jgi:hypothetical protein
MTTMLPLADVWRPDHPARGLATMQPVFPIYIVSLGRASLDRGTIRALSRMRVPFTVVAEPHEVSDYRDTVERHGGYGRVVALDPDYARTYEPLIDLAPGASRGSGPARNFAWDHAAADGHAYYWCMDDNLIKFGYLFRNRKPYAADAFGLRYIEEATRRVSNVAMAGPHYENFLPRKSSANSTIVGGRIYSCNLIRTDVRQRWRGRYNEDTILSLDLLKAGWATLLFRFAFAVKPKTLTTAGGNTDTIYNERDAHLRKAALLVAAHPDVARVTERYGRVHHYVDYSRWSDMQLIPFDDAPPMPSFTFAPVSKTDAWAAS